jgi:hypothetical protein
MTDRQETLREAAQTVVDRFPPDDRPRTPRGVAIENLRAALAAEPPARPYETFTANDGEVSIRAAEPPALDVQALFGAMADTENEVESQGIRFGLDASLSDYVAILARAVVRLNESAQARTEAFTCTCTPLNRRLMAHLLKVDEGDVHEHGCVERAAAQARTEALDEPCLYPGCGHNALHTARVEP